MAVRRVLTVISIIIFSWIAANYTGCDLPGEGLTKAGLHVKPGGCMGCTLCAKNYPELFVMENKKALAKPYECQYG
jgi:hypothetical protein